MVEPVEVAHDRRECRRHDRLVQRGQEHAQHEPAQDDQDLAVGETAAGLVLGNGAARLGHDVAEANAGAGTPDTTP